VDLLFALWNVFCSLNNV